MDNHIHVTCAIIERDGLVLAAKRGAAMKMPHKWEFPGGKICLEESPESCLQREILEELDVQIQITRNLQPVSHDYPDFRITLYPFVCSIDADEPRLNEHASVIWLPPKELSRLDWAEADRPVLEAYCQSLNGEM